MNSVNLNRRYKTILLSYSSIFLPILALVLTWWNSLLPQLTNFGFFSFYFTNLFSLASFWGLSLLVNSYIRNEDTVKLFNYKPLGYYISINTILPFLISLGVFYLLGIVSETNFSFRQLVTLSLPVSGVSLCGNLLYDVILLSKEKNRTEEKAAHLEVEKIKAEINILKAQINPHFIFNSMNTLAFLTSSDPPAASRFIELFSRIYRFVLDHINTDWITLNEELILLEDYIGLQKIKYKDAIQLSIQIRDYVTNRYFIPPLSLQILAENAIKHNYFSEQEPLQIEIQVTSNMILFRNKYKEQAVTTTSTKLGLHNLRERYRLLTEKQIIIRKTGDEFIVHLPILKKSFL